MSAPIRRLPSRRITRRLSFSSPDSSQNKSKKRAFEIVDSDSPKTPKSSPINRTDIDTEESQPSIPTTPRSTLKTRSPSLSCKENIPISSLNHFDDHNVNSSPKSHHLSSIERALTKSRRRLYMEQMFKERRAMRRRNLEKQNNDQVVFEFRGLRL